MLDKKNYIGFGSSRIAFDNGDGYVIKYPLFSMGIVANREEYKNYLNNKDIVAETILLDNGLLLQEKLKDCYEFTRKEVESEDIEQLLLDKYGEESKKFFNKMFHKKLCIGKNSKGELMQYDYEDIKNSFEKEFMEKEPALVITEDMVDDVINFLNKIGIDNVNKYFYKECKMGLQKPSYK